MKINQHPPFRLRCLGGSIIVHGSRCGHFVSPFRAFQPTTGDVELIRQLQKSSTKQPAKRIQSDNAMFQAINEPLLPFHCIILRTGVM